MASKGGFKNTAACCPPRTAGTRHGGDGAAAPESRRCPAESPRGTKGVVAIRRTLCSRVRGGGGNCLLLVQGLCVGGDGGDVGVAGSLVGAGGELELLGGRDIGVALGLVGVLVGVKIKVGELRQGPERQHLVRLPDVRKHSSRGQTLGFTQSGARVVEGLGVGGGGGDVGVAGSLVGAGGELELVGGLEVGIAGSAVGGGVLAEVEHELEHLFCGATGPRQSGRTRQHTLPFTNNAHTPTPPLPPLHPAPTLPPPQAGMQRGAMRPREAPPPGPAAVPGTPTEDGVRTTQPVLNFSPHPPHLLSSLLAQHSCDPAPSPAQPPGGGVLAEVEHELEHPDWKGGGGGGQVSDGLLHPW
eukprot:CAMPEP_0174950800 /NCGR_PEP_ID=MMETSP1355-20121228/94517_1 /TAXON_ID=464990 /ORGANISM="Hemiselmis tepida, Strain CCMP443" /LENGTH=356 /DNA_ID=CAMNT_0016198435 /DNA_START=147 /DNA_END=1219 /DNA_ORIENTATION=+